MTPREICVILLVLLLSLLFPTTFYSEKFQIYGKVVRITRLLYSFSWSSIVNILSNLLLFLLSFLLPSLLSFFFFFLLNHLKTRCRYNILPLNTLAYITWEYNLMVISKSFREFPSDYVFSCVVIFVDDGTILHFMYVCVNIYFIILE